MLPRADQDVSRRLGRDVLEGKNIRILVENLARDRFATDLAEKTIVHGKGPPGTGAGTGEFAGVPALQHCVSSRRTTKVCKPFAPLKVLASFCAASGLGSRPTRTRKKWPLG